MPFYSLRDQGFDMPFEALGKGLLAWRTRQQQEKENQRADQALKLQQERNAFEQNAETQRLGLSRDEYDLRKRIYDTKTKPFDPSAVPAGMQINKMSMTPDGWSADVAPPPQIPEGMRPSKSVVGPHGIETTYAPPPPSQPSSPIVELPLPDGSKGMFLTHVDPDTGVTKFTPYTPPKGTEGKPLDVDTIKKLEQLDLADAQFAELEKFLEDSKTEGGPIKGLAVEKTPFAGAYDPVRNEFKRLSASLMSPVARGLYNETGALAKSDEERYSGILPQYTDTYQNRTNKLAKLKKVAQDSRASVMKNVGQAGRDISAFQPPPVPGPELDFSGNVDVEAETMKALSAGVPLAEIQRRMMEMPRQP